MTSPLKCFTLNPYIAILLFVTMQLAQKESGNSRFPFFRSIKLRDLAWKTSKSQSKSLSARPHILLDGFWRVGLLLDS